MLIIMFDDEAIMFQGLLSVSKLVQDLSQPKVCWHTIRIEFDAVLEVFLSLVEVTAVRKLGSQMYACSKVTLIIKQALLEMIDGILELLDPLVLASNVEVSL